MPEPDSTSSAPAPVLSPPVGLPMHAQVESPARGFARKALIAVMIAAAVVLVIFFIYQIMRVLVMAFAAMLFAVLLTGLTRLVTRGTKMPRLLALGGVLVMLVALFAAAGLFIGKTIEKEVIDLQVSIPEAFKAMTDRLGPGNWWVDQIRAVQTYLQEFFTFDALKNPTALGIAGTTIGVIGSMLVVFVVGVYMAVNPEIYIAGLAMLFPPRNRPRVRDILTAIGRALQWWLVGQFMAMLGVFLLTYVGLKIVGLKASLALALLAGLFNVIPNFGPILAAIPAVLLAAAPHGGNPDFDFKRAVYVVVLYSIVQAIDAYVVTPFIQKRAVSLPPALIMLGQIAAFLLLGPVGLLLATPILAALLVLIRKSYIEDVLGDRGS